MTVINKDFVVNNGLQITGYITSVGGSTPTNGQLLIGDATNSRFSLGTLTSSNGVSLALGAGTIAVSTNATSANTASTIVSRDATGNFVAGSITGVAAQKAIVASNGGGTGQTSMVLTRTGAATDNKGWEFLAASNGALVVRTINDAYTASINGMIFNRDTGYGITNVQLMPGSGNVLLGTAADDGVNKLQVNGSIAGSNLSTGNAGLALTGLNGFSAGVVMTNTTASTGRKYSIYSNTAGNMILGDETVSAARIAITPSGRILMGIGLDDGVNQLQVNGTILATTPALGSNNTQVATTAFVANLAGDYQSWTYLNGPTTLVGSNSGSIYFCGGTGGYTVTLPAPSTANMTFTITNVTTDSSVITISTPSASIYNQTAATSTFMLGVGATIKIFADSSNWTILEHYTKSPNFIGTPTATTPAAGTNNTQIATTAFVANSFAPLNNPTFTGRVYLPEGSVTAPGLTFVNDGTLDTGLYHISDGSFGVTCNQIAVATFSNTAGTTFLKPAVITSGSVDGTPVGATTASTGSFTSLSASGTTSLGGRLTRQVVSISAAGTTQATATATSADVIYISGGTAGSATGVQLPACATGSSCYVINNSGITVTLYPPVGAYIDWNAQNVGISIPTQTKLDFVCVGTTNWFSIGATYS